MSNNDTFNPFRIASYSPEQFAGFAAQFRAKAAAAAAERNASFERCDTDGFLSQWASGLTDELHSQQANILENGGKSYFSGLYEGSRRIKAKLIEGKFGQSWLLHESETDLIARRGKRFLPRASPSGKSRILSGLGLSERIEKDWAWAKLEGRGKGLSGTCWAQSFRAGDEWGGTATLTQIEG